MKKQILIFILSLVVFSCKKEIQISYDLIIENGNVIDIVSGNMSKQTIFINDERIVKLANPNKSEKSSFFSLISKVEINLNA